MWVLSFWFHSRNKKTKCESLFILWGLWVSSTTAEAWVKMRAYMYIKELIKSGINLDSASLFQSRCQSVDQNTYMGQKIPIKVTSLCSQTAFHTLRSQTTLLKFLKLVLVCAKLPQCWRSPDNISMIFNVPMIFESPGKPRQSEEFRVWTFNHFFPTHFIIRWTKISKSNSIPLHTKPYDLFMLKFKLGVSSNLAITTKYSNDLCTIPIIINHMQIQRHLVSIPEHQWFPLDERRSEHT